jgi:outer membrane protein TolC
MKPVFVRQSPRRVACAGALCALLVAVTAQAAEPISLQRALDVAAAQDPWIDRSSHVENALRERGTAAAALPDPVVSVGLANLPTDTFDFNQEPMTQARIGVTQRIPRGDVRDLQRRRFADLGAQQPLARDNRRAEVARDVTRSWLELYRAQESLALVADSRGLFAYLVELTRSRYSAAVGSTRQEDLLRAELELTRLEDRFQALRAERDSAAAVLERWLIDPRQAVVMGPVTAVDDELPVLALGVPIADASALREELSQRLPLHPAVLALDQRIVASGTEVAIAEQAYRPGWSINASYGYRDDTPLGDDRADFFSVGVAFEVPLFTSARQDPQVRAAVADGEALRTERALLLRDLQSRALGEFARMQRLDERAALYRDRLLPQAEKRAAATLGGYRADAANFDDVIRARIDELNARITAIEVDVRRLTAIAELNYLFTVAAAPQGGAS